ncbi:MAG: CCA tRNA nucleotidyltransferase [Nitratireductor sp.]|nr:CCA tRNA nucleotidyltransferase [Nitratireductor sp.]
MKLSSKQAPWLHEARLQAVFDAIEAAGGEARVAGGAVRNTLMGEAVGDVDLATTLVPEATMEALEKAGLKAVPTGIDHGTITAVSDGTGYEITTIRDDIETDGRHAVVRFGTDWERDALRRDLTINGLYCDRQGEIFDPLDSLNDVKARQVRFIGDAGERIEEDYLRILRFFRFFAQYGAGRPDAEGLKAVTRLKEGLQRVSAERIWMELRKLLAARDPSRALLWMRTTGVLNLIVPESEKWGIDFVAPLIEAETRFGWQSEAIQRLQAMIRPDGAIARKLAKRLKLSNADRDRLLAWAMAELPEPPLGKDGLKQQIYFGDQQAITDRLRLAAAIAISRNEPAEKIEAIADNADFSSNWMPPQLPVSGKDLVEKGIPEGREIGRLLKRLEKTWVESGFSLSAKALLKDL